MVSNYHNADCSLRKKLIVSLIIIFGTLSSPMKPLQYWAESAVYARLFVGGGEALAWRRRAKASHVVHRGVGTDTKTESAGGGTGPRGEVCCLRSAGGCRRWRSVGLATTSESVACRASRSGESGE